MLFINELAAKMIHFRPLDKLIDGDFFVVKATFRKDSIGIEVRTLINTKAQAWILADRAFCQRIASSWSLPRTTYDKPAIVKGFENKPLQSIQTSIPANLQLSGRTFDNTPLLETNLGDRKDFQLIIGLRFLAHYSINLDCARRKLLFPKELPYSNAWTKDILVLLSSLNCRPSRKAQRDMERRDQL